MQAGEDKFRNVTWRLVGFDVINSFIYYPTDYQRFELFRLCSVDDMAISHGISRTMIRVPHSEDVNVNYVSLGVTEFCHIYDSVHSSDAFPFYHFQVDVWRDDPVVDVVMV